MRARTAGAASVGRVATTMRRLGAASAMSVVLAACGQTDPSAPDPTASVSGAVSAAGGGIVVGASVGIGSATTTTGPDGRFDLRGLPTGSATIAVSAVGFDARSDSLTLRAGVNVHDVVLTLRPTAHLSGVVSAVTGEIVEGATVRIGSATATTDADGRYELQGLPVGGATITTTAARFDQRVESVSLDEGTNVHDVVMAHQTIFSHHDVVAYLPYGILEYEAAIVFLPGLRDPLTGNPLDSRPLVRGTADGACSIWCPQAEQAEVRSRALQLLGGNVALVGTTTLLPETADYDKLLEALSAFGAQSLHPELADLPILFVGHSMGGCTAYGFSRVHGARVAGFLTMKGACHDTGPAAEAGDVPGYFLIGELDAPYRRENITAVFEAGRAAAAPWALSIDDFEHGPMLDFDAMFDWIGAVLAARLPHDPGATLRPVTETDGWLGDRSTGAIATWPCFASDRSSASWLPDQETALDWQRMARGSVVVSEC